MLKCSILFIMKEIIIFMTACKPVIGNYKGLYNADQIQYTDPPREHFIKTALAKI